MDKEVKKELLARGWTSTGKRNGQGHEVWTNGVFAMPFASTMSDYRGLRNALADIRRLDEAKAQGLKPGDDPRLIRGMRSRGVRIIESRSADSAEEETEAWQDEAWAKEQAQYEQLAAEVAQHSEGTMGKAAKTIEDVKLSPEVPMAPRVVAEKLGLSASAVSLAAQLGSLSTSGYFFLKYPAPASMPEAHGRGKLLFCVHCVPPEEARAWAEILDEEYGTPTLTPLDNLPAGDAAKPAARQGAVKSPAPPELGFAPVEEPTTELAVLQHRYDSLVLATQGTQAKIEQLEARAATLEERLATEKKAVAAGKDREMALQRELREEQSVVTALQRQLQQALQAKEEANNARVDALNAFEEARTKAPAPATPSVAPSAQLLETIEKVLDRAEENEGTLELTYQELFMLSRAINKLTK